MDTITTRAEAKAEGHRHYFSGKPCPRGHVGARLVSNGNCVACNAETSKLWHEANKQTSKSYKQRYAQANPDKVKASRKRWSEHNPGYVRANSARWRKAVVRATPKCQTLEQKRQIEAIYAARKPSEHIDHIHPLHGKNSCGLHVPWNLQPLPSLDNLRKSNK